MLTEKQRDIEDLVADRLVEEEKCGREIRNQFVCHIVDIFKACGDQRTPLYFNKHFSKELEQTIDDQSER